MYLCILLCVCINSITRNAVDNEFSSLSLIMCNYLGALTLLVGCHEEHSACKNYMLRCWCDYLSGARCRFFAYDAADATAISKPRHILPYLNQTGFIFLVPA